MKIINEKHEIVDLLNQYHVLAMPTDTVYGLILKANKENEFILKNVKSRPECKPLPVVVDSVDTLLNIIDVPSQYHALLHSYLPGGLTIVANAKLDLGNETLAVRVPNNKLMLDVVKQVGPCWLTSANVSGCEPCLNALQVEQALAGRIEYVVEGNCELGVPSTIVSFVNETPTILRQGSVEINF